MVWSVAIYGSEGWTLRRKEEEYIKAFEVWCYRRLLRILWTQHKTNECILCKLKVDRELLDCVKALKILKLGFYGYTTWKYESLEKEMVQGCVPGYRSCGRQRRRWTDDITEWTGMKINEAAAAAEDRDRWRGILRAATLLMEDGTKRRRRRFRGSLVRAPIFWRCKTFVLIFNVKKIYAKI